MIRTIILFIFISLNTKSQTILTGTNAPSGIGETLSLAIFDSVFTLPKSTGASQVWDFSNLINTGNIKQIQYSYPINVPCVSNLNSPPPQNFETNGVFGGYNATWQGINYEWVGYTDLSHTVKFTNYATIYAWPVAFGYNQYDTFSGSTVSPTTCSTTHETWTGSLTTTAPGQGTVILPGGISFSNCLQVLKEQTTNIVSNSTGTVTLQEIEYKYYHSSQKYPLIYIQYIKFDNGPYYPKILIDNNHVTTSLNSIEKKELISIYPNPTNDLLFYNNNTTLDDNVSYKLLSTNGVCLKTGNSNLNNGIDVSDLENGIYFLEINIRQNKEYKKFIKN